MLFRPLVNLCSTASVYNLVAAKQTTSDSRKIVAMLWIFLCAVNQFNRGTGETLSRHTPLAIVCSLESLLPRFPNGPLIFACANEMPFTFRSGEGICRRSNSLDPCATYEPCTLAAPEVVSPNVTSDTIVFSSTTVPHFTL